MKPITLHLSLQADFLVLGVHPRGFWMVGRDEVVGEGMFGSDIWN